VTNSDQERHNSRRARLARLGFTDAARAEVLAARAELGFGLLTEIAASADPDLALESVVHLVEATQTSFALDDQHNALALHNALQTDVDFRHRLFAVLGSSSALGDHLATHPVDWKELAEPGVDDSRPSWLGLRAGPLPKLLCGRRTDGCCCVSQPETSRVRPRSTTLLPSSRISRRPPSMPRSWSRRPNCRLTRHRAGSP
jgi:glutamate-ammonia-ligase adenylyltransferase